MRPAVLQPDTMRPRRLVGFKSSDLSFPGSAGSLSVSLSHISNYSVIDTLNSGEETLQLSKFETAMPVGGLS